MQGEQLDVRIKWPNDVYASGKKIAGVLTHSAYRNKVFRITVGCGINVANSEPSTCLDDLLRQQRPDAQPINKEVGSCRLCPDNTACQDGVCRTLVHWQTVQGSAHRHAGSKGMPARCELS